MMLSRWSMTQALLGIFATSAVIATALGLALGFDLLVTPPTIPETLDFPSRLDALEPFHRAQWPFDAALTLLYVVGFGALMLAAESIAALAAADRRAAILKTAIVASGLLAVAGGLLYIGATQVTMSVDYCDCGFKNEEVISRFWALAIVQGATNWLSYGAIAFGAAGMGVSALIFGPRMPAIWRWIAWSGAGLLPLSVLLHEVSDTPAGDLVAALATGILLPMWAVILGMRAAHLNDDADPLIGSS